MRETIVVAQADDQSPRALTNSGSDWRSPAGIIRTPEGFGISIVMLQVVLNGGFEFTDAFEDAARNALLGQTIRRSARPD